MATPTRRSVWISCILAATAALLFILTGSKPNDTEWLSAPPAGGPLRFRFLGDKWAWKINGFWQRLKPGKPKSIALTAQVTDLDSLDCLTNLPPALFQATNPTGDRFWVFVARENLPEKVPSWPGVQVVARPQMTWTEGNQAQLATHTAIPLGFSNQFVMAGWQLDVWAARTAGDCLRLTVFATVNERDRTKVRWVSNTVTDSGVRTNAYFGARVTVPTNGTVFLLSGRTNAEGKYFGALLSPSLP